MMENQTYGENSINPAQVVTGHRPRIHPWAVVGSFVNVYPRGTDCSFTKILNW